MLKLNMETLSLFLLVVIATVGGTYVVDTTTKNIDKPEDICPEKCQCSHTERTTQCYFTYADFTLNDMLPWQLAQLQIHGDTSLWNPKNSRLSVTQVLSGDDFKSSEIEEKLSSKEMLSELTHLDISYIPIYEISNTDLSVASSLQFLTLTNNNISHVHPHAFKFLTKLEVLNLDSNQISSLPDGIFKNLGNLKTLQLRSNSLTVLQASQFVGLVSLEMLDLQNNLIQQLETCIDGLNTLNTIDIRDNKISYISEDSVNKLLTFNKALINRNPFWCSCSLSSLIEAVQLDSSVFDDSIECLAPQKLVHVRFGDLDMKQLTCDGPNITTLALSSGIMHQTSLLLDCTASGDLPLSTYWVTPWGETFTNKQSQLTFLDHFDDMKMEKTYDAVYQVISSSVHVSNNGSLHIDKYRGFFSGHFTCVAVNLIGQSNRTIFVGIDSAFRSIYITSLFIGAYSAGALLGIAIILGLIRMFVNKCLHVETCNCCCCRCDDVEIIEEKIKPEDFEFEVDVTCSDSLTSLDYTDYDPSHSPPYPPFNSPQLRHSPDRSVTPNSENFEEDPNKLPPIIWDQLDEVRTRLRCGAERKMEKVRSHVRSFTDTGSLKIRNIKDAGSMKIQSIKESGSHAATIMRKNMASGMVQVKYGVQSIKEFCGTSDMGPGTISMMSVTTDVDTTERIQVIKSHTFV